MVEGDPTAITLYGSGRSFGPHPEDCKAFKAVFDSEASRITLTICEERHGISVPLTLQFTHRPD
ncbi:3-oxoacyl-[acyl-carrier-protein] synthase [Serendipita sp. 401]|nr:3-oxoacyl-[acyl-carrier-protein] synthase [Serendipita sp. 401]KAG9051951.1 3-oxoacyl-[acyl-carrier-protein] synthase [Serendipita sp. 407]